MILTAGLALGAGLLVSSCASSGGSCVPSDTVKLCAQSVSNGVEVAWEGISAFATGSVGVAGTNPSTPIPADAAGTLPATFAPFSMLDEGSTVDVHVSAGARSIDRSVRASA